jgi:hypothetical protein
MDKIGTWLLSQIQGFAKPAYLAAIIVIGIYFLVKREFLRIIELGLVAALAGMFIFDPSVFQNLANAIGNGL